jgi:2,3-bisphosphoglycerate-independent phosphoglycerate mutase
MDIHDLTRELRVKNDSKIVLLVADGLGGLPMESGGKTELETARKPNLDALAARGVQGASIPVLPGIAPGSGPGHLGLFGYDPLKYVIGRGALEATGIGFVMKPGDVAIRGNYCTLDASGNISDRRAGRIPSEESAPLAAKLRDVKIPGVEVFVEPVKEHRFVVVFRGPGLAGNVKDTDPQKTGVPPLPAEPHDEASAKTAQIANEFVKQATKILAGQSKANGLTLRGRSLRAQSRRHRCVSDVQRSCQPRRHDARRQSPNARRPGEAARRELERLRLLLSALQIHRQHRRGRQL